MEISILRHKSDLILLSFSTNDYEIDKPTMFIDEKVRILG
jgi:hypothetical protein